jgi:ubiquinone/menaquinone biosynthesis C-methylase UbiE
VVTQHDPKFRILDHPAVAAMWKDVAKSLVEQGYAGPVSPMPVEAMAPEMFSDDRVEEQLDELRRFTALQGKKILEVGSGWGALIARGRKAYNWDIWGVEPGADAFKSAFGASQKLLQALDIPLEAIVNGVGEDLPFPDAEFDVVYSAHVLEHVKDPRKVLDEAIRVLKPGGTLQFVVPNFGSWWEGHYGVLWWPNTPRWLGKLYVKLLGRDPAYMDTLQLINRRTLERHLSAHGDGIQILGWGVDVWERRVRTLEYSEWGSIAGVTHFMKVIKRLGLTSLLIAVGKALHWETPIILTLRKAAPD